MDSLFNNFQQKVVIHAGDLEDASIGSMEFLRHLVTYDVWIAISSAIFTTWLTEIFVQCASSKFVFRNRSTEGKKLTNNMHRPFFIF